jgi:hypothetical protein
MKQYERKGQSPPSPIDIVITVRHTGSIMKTATCRQHLLSGPFLSGPHLLLR